MSFHERWVLPPLLDLAMRHPELRRYRMRVAPRAGGTVLEIGAGTGLNFAYYSPGARVIALDPAEALLHRAERRARDAPVPVEFIASPGETIPLDDASVDNVVMTWTLCSIPEPLAALGEIRRVLRPHGRLYFAEHGRAPDAGVAAWQRRLNRVWTPLAGGCRLDRQVDVLLHDAGLRIEDLDAGYARLPRVLGYMYVGSASVR